MVPCQVCGISVECEFEELLDDAVVVALSAGDH